MQRVKIERSLNYDVLTVKSVHNLPNGFYLAKLTGDPTDLRVVHINGKECNAYSLDGYPAGKLIETYTFLFRITEEDFAGK